MELNEIVQAFAEEFGIKSIPADENGAYNLEIDGIGIMLATIGEGTQLGMFAELGEPPDEGREILYRAFLETMAPGEGVESIMFSIPPSTGRIVMSRTDSLDSTDYAAFKERLESFVNLAEEWRRNIADIPMLSQKVGEAVKVMKDESRELGESGFMRV